MATALACNESQEVSFQYSPRSSFHANSNIIWEIFGILQTIIIYVTHEVQFSKVLRPSENVYLKYLLKTLPEKNYFGVLCVLENLHLFYLCLFIFIF